MSKQSEEQHSGRQRGALRGRAGRMKGGRGSGRAGGGAVRLWGHHAVEAALKNPDRRHRKLWATREAIAGLDGELPADFVVEYAQGADLARLPISTAMESLNVSNATAIALYAVATR